MATDWTSSSPRLRRPAAWNRSPDTDVVRGSSRISPQPPTGYPAVLGRFLDELGVPESLRGQLDYGPITDDRWPPRPGCGASPDRAVLRLWARLDLAEWIGAAPNAFGPHGTGVLDGLAVAGARLRCAGEGAYVLWGIDVVPAEEWVTYPSAGLAVVELVCLGPYLGDRLVDETDTALTRLCWRYNTDHANQPCVVNSVRCYENSWTEANTRSTFPPAPHARRGSRPYEGM